MKARDLILSAVVASLLGLLVLQWEWLAKLFGIAVQVERSSSVITVEYLWGMVAVAGLGFLFYSLPAWSAVWFMYAPAFVTHLAYIAKFGIPGQWGLQALILALLTLPYIGIAYAAAYLRRRIRRNATQ